MNCSPSYTPTKYRRTRSPLTLAPLYDHTDPAVFAGLHCAHGTITETEAIDLIAKAKANAKLGTEFIPHGLDPKALQFFHRM